MNTQNNSAPKPSWVKSGSSQPDERPSWVKTITKADAEPSSVTPEDAAYAHVNKASSPVDPAIKKILSVVGTGFALLLGVAISRGVIKPAMRQNAAPTSSESVPYSSSASTPGVVKTSMSEEEETNRGRAVGFMAQTICSARRYNYSREEVAQKYAMFEKVYGDYIYRLMEEPVMIRAASQLAMIMNSNCTNITDEAEMTRITRPIYE